MKFVLWRCLSLPFFLYLSSQCSFAQTNASDLITQDDLFEKLYTLAVPDQEGVVVWPWLASPVDFNADGKKDIILFGHHSSEAYIWYGAANEAVLLQKEEWIFGALNPLWLDVDSDGDFDAIGNYGWGVENNLFINRGGKFRKALRQFDYPIDDVDDAANWIEMPDHLSISLHPLGAKFRENFYVDLNNDGDDERVINFWGTDPEDASLYQIHSWLLGKDGRKWTDITSRVGLPDGNTRILFPDDFDVDGDIDLVDVHNGDLFINDQGDFTRAAQKLFTGNSPYNGDGSLQVIDLDNNGYRDYVFGFDHDSSHGIFMNFSGHFNKLQGDIIPGNRRLRRFADLDDDGDLDMISFNARDEITVWRNKTGNPGAFVEYQGDLFGPTIRVEQDGKLIHYRQRIQESRMSRSNMYSHSIHVGGIDPNREITVVAEEH